MYRDSLIVLVLAFVFAAGSADARPQRLSLEPEHTSVSFFLVGNTHDVHGNFAMRMGELRFDDEAGAAEGRIVLDATSAVTGNAKRDKKMHSKVLESASFADIAFDVTGLRGQVSEGESDIVLLGRITLLGVEHDVELPAHVVRKGPEVEATAELVVPYVAWGLEDPSVFVFRVAKEVRVDVELSGRLGELTAR